MIDEGRGQVIESWPLMERSRSQSQHTRDEAQPAAVIDYGARELRVSGSFLSHALLRNKLQGRVND
jgi:hypothetical protein